MRLIAATSAPYRVRRGYPTVIVGGSGCIVAALTEGSNRR
jgi:hypothetical protein